MPYGHFNLTLLEKTQSSSLEIIASPLGEQGRLPEKFVNSLLDFSKNFSENIQQNSFLFLVENFKSARKLFLAHGISKEFFQYFELFSEHQQNDQKYIQELVGRLKIKSKHSKKLKAYLISESGVATFCDPGQLLILECHRASVPVLFSDFSNSLIWALALSGFPCPPFYFWGFLPRQTQEREIFWKNITKQETFTKKNVKTIAFMETPYRSSKICEEILKQIFFLKKNGEPVHRFSYFFAYNAQTEKEGYSYCLSTPSLTLEEYQTFFETLHRNLEKSPCVFLLTII